MRRLLVTGGAGFIGSNFAHYWLRHYPADRVVILDALTYAGKLDNLCPIMGHAELQFVHGDIRDTSLVATLLRTEGLDTIVHFAAESHVDRSIAAPDAFIETNVIGTHSLLKAARGVWLEEKSVPTHRFHHVSTDEVYGSLDPDDPAFTETTPYAPNSPYSASKAAADHLVRAYQRTYGLQTTISNCSNNYGPRQHPEKLIPLVIANILRGKPLPVYGDGRNVRDWIFVDDHCRGIDCVLRAGKPGQAYNIGGGCECANIDIVRSLCAIVDERIGASKDLRRRFPNSPAVTGTSSEALIEYVEDRPGHDRRYALNSSKLAMDCGYLPSVSLQMGLHHTVDWFLSEFQRLSAIECRTPIGNHAANG